MATTRTIILSFLFGLTAGFWTQCQWPLSFCNSCREIAGTDTVFTIKYLVDSSAKKFEPRPDQEPVVTFYPESIPEIDSAAVAYDYFSTRYYQREFRDSNVAITSRDSITRNRIAWSQLEYKLLIPTQIQTYKITNTVYPKGLYWRVNLFASGANKFAQNAIGAGAGIGYKKGPAAADISFNYLTGHSGILIQASYSHDIKWNPF